MNLASFLTPQTQNTAQFAGKPATSLQNLKTQTQGLTQTTANGDTGLAQGVSIFDLLLNQVNEGLQQTPLTLSEQQKQTAQTDFALQNKIAFFENNKTLLPISADGESINIESQSLDTIAGFDLITQIQNALSLNQSVIDNNLTPDQKATLPLLANKITQASTPVDITQTLNIIQNDDGLLNNDISNLINLINNLGEENGDGKEGLLTLLNLTPEQITELKTIDENIVPTDEQLEAIEAVITGFIALLTPAQTSNPLDAASAATPEDLTALIHNAAQQLKSSAEDLLIKQEVTKPSSNNASALPDDAVNNNNIDDFDFDALLKLETGKKYEGNAEHIANKGEKNNNTNQQNNAANTNALPNTQNPLNNGALFGTTSYTDQMAGQMGLSLTGQNSIAQGSTTALVTQSQQAAQAHPGTQMVAAQITKAGANGQDTNISLRLDPPDLGRVDISLKFSSDKKVKAVVTAEKPETYQMLQRDTQVLERALQNAGLEAEGSLSFELAKDGHFFNDQNNRGGGHDNGGTGKGSGHDSDGIEIIESTMTWNINPDTGYVSYDILA